MSLLLTYTHNYITYYDTESIIHTYLDINASSISEMIYNINHKVPLTSSITRHIFIKRIEIKGDQRYIYNSFISSEEFAMLLTTVRLPHNHRIEILYIVEDRIYSNTYLIGNEFVITNTINECNDAISHITSRFTPWINRVYNERCILGELNESRIVKLLKDDRCIDERHIDTYYEEMVVCKAMLDIIGNVTPNVGINHTSLHNVLTTIDDRIDIDIPNELRSGNANIITSPIINALMNLDKIRYSVTSIDDILSVSISKDTLKDHINHGF